MENSNNKNGQYQKGYRNSPATEFKKGHIPANVRPMYSERIVCEGKRCVRKAVQIKVKKGGRWEYRARYVWREAGLSVPKGYVMYHKDGDGLNDDIKNLDCISRSELMKRNNLKKSY